jgi:hypothetical protein
MTTIHDQPRSRVAAGWRRVARLVAVAFLAIGLGAARGAPDSSAARSILFEDHFDGKGSGGWRFDRPGVWRVSGGRFRAELPPQRQLRSFAYVGDVSWRDYSVDFDVCGVRGVDKGIAVRVEGKRGVGIDLRGGRYGDLLMYEGFDSWGKEPVANVDGEWIHMRVEVRGAQYRVWVRGRLVLDYTDPDQRRPHGGIALAAYTGGTGACLVLYDNVVVRALD